MRPVLLTLLGLLACDGDSSLKVTNSDPTATITAPDDDASVMEQTFVTLIGTVGDPNHSTTDLSVSWWADGEELCGATAPDADGTTSCEATFLPGRPSIKLQVSDPAGATAEDRLTLDVQEGETPSVVLEAPAGGERYYARSPIDFVASVSDDEDPAEELVLSWTSSVDGELALPTSADSDGSVSGTVILSEGDHEISLTAEDTTGHVGSARVTILVESENESPDCEITDPEGAIVAEFGDNITFMASIDDVHEAPTELLVEWSSDKDGPIGTSVADSDGSVTFATSVLSAETHTVTLTVTDELGETCTDSRLVSVGYRPEATISTPTTGETFNEGDTVTFSGVVSDNEDDPTDLSVSWTSDLDGDLGASAADSSGLTGVQTTTLSAGSHFVSLAATDSDGLTGRATLLVVVNGLPSAPGVTLGPSGATTSDDLVASVTTPAVDPEGSTLTYEYEWSRNGIVESSWTTDTVSASATARGETWSVEVRANDGTGLGAAGTDALTVVNSAPVVASVTLTPSSVTTNDTVTASVSASDGDGDSLTYTYDWSVNGISVGVSGASLDGTTHFDRGDVISVSVSASDGTDASASVSATATVGNSPPEIASVSLAPSAVYTNDTLTSTVGTVSDPDGDTVTLAYTWKVDGTSTGTTGTTLDGATWFERDEVVTVTVTPSDGTDTGTAVSDSVTVLNSAPTAPVVTISPSDPTEGVDDLLCEVSVAATDADGDPLTYSAVWEVDGTEYPDPDTGSLHIGPSTTTWTDDTVPGADTLEGEDWTCAMTADDGTDAGPDGTDGVTIGTASTCGNGVLDPGEEYDGGPIPYSNISVDPVTCRWDFSSVDQLYCNGGCTWAGGSGCDQADADILCKLITDNPASTATSWTATLALSTYGFSCPSLGDTLNVVDRGVSVPVYYYDSSIRSTHGPGSIVAYPVCTDP